MSEVIHRPASVPPAAEAFSWLDWTRGRRAPSQLIPGTEQIIPELVCPRCREVEPAPGYGETTICKGCGLRRQWAAGYIFAWDEEKAA